MALFNRILEDRILLVDAASAPTAAPSGTPAWTSVANLQTALNTAVTQKKPVFILPCTINTGAVTFAPSAGLPNRLIVRADPGTVVWSLNASAAHLLRMQGMVDSFFEGIIFDGTNKTITESSTVAGLVRFDAATTTNCVIDNCEVRNSTQCGISMSNGAQCIVRNSRVYTCSIGIWSLDSESIVENNRVSGCSNNGIAVWRSAITGDNSVVRGNHIEQISNALGGTGQYGNAINVFRADFVKIQSNMIFTCSYSAVRINGSPSVEVTGNTCYNLREVAIFVEAPAAGINTDNGVVSNNVINTAGVGISIANSGLYSDGSTRGLIVSGNQVQNIVSNAIPDPGYSPPQTTDVGIVCEQETTVVGNFVDTTAGGGIVLGTNNAARKLIASCNIVRNAKFGIGFSSDPAANDIIVTSNVLFGYQVASGTGDPKYPLSGAIVPAAFNGTNYYRTTSNTTDYGNNTETRVGALTVASNRASP